VLPAAKVEEERPASSPTKGVKAAGSEEGLPARPAARSRGQLAISPGNAANAFDARDSSDLHCAAITSMRHGLIHFTASTKGITS